MASTEPTQRTSPRDPRVGLGLRLIYLLGPFALTAAVLAVVYFVAGPWTLNEVWITGLVSLMGAGTTVVFGEAAFGENTLQLRLDTWELAYVVMFVNAVSSVFYTYNLDLLQKLPRVGPWLRRARINARTMLAQRPWIRRWAVFGVGLFVVTPLPGSGALGGSLMGRLVGLSKRGTVLAVSVAGFVVCSVYALLASELKEALDRLEQFTPAWVRIAVFLLVAVVLIWLMTKLVRWLARQPQAPQTGPSSAGAPNSSER